MSTAVLSRTNLLLMLAIGCFGIVGAGILVQHLFSLAPCPLCIAERICFGLCGMVALAGWMYRSKTRWQEMAVVLGIELFAIIGAGITWRQIFLQAHPDTSGATCAFFPSVFEQMLAALGGVGNCSEQTWTLVGLSLPEWALILFIGIILVGGMMVWEEFGRERVVS